jgi:hypothetical protein
VWLVKACYFISFISGVLSENKHRPSGSRVLLAIGQPVDAQICQ